MKKKEEYECKGCGYKVKCDPKEVPFQCKKCNAFDYPFMRVEKSTLPAKILSVHQISPSLMHIKIEPAA